MAMRYYRGSASFYGGSLGSQEMLDAYYGDADSVFTDDSYGDGGLRLGDSVSVINNGDLPSGGLPRQVRRSATSTHMMMPPPPMVRRSAMASSVVSVAAPVRGAVAPFPARQRVLSDPELGSYHSDLPFSGREGVPSRNSNHRFSHDCSDLYVNQSELMQQRQDYDDETQSSSNGSWSQPQAPRMHHTRDPSFLSERAAPVTPPCGPLANSGCRSMPTSPARNGTLKRPIPTPRSILNISNSTSFADDSASESTVVTQIRQQCSPQSTYSNGVHLLQPNQQPISPPLSPQRLQQLHPVHPQQMSPQQAYNGSSVAPPNINNNSIKRRASRQYTPIDRLIMCYSQFVIDPTDPSEICHICQLTLDVRSPCVGSDDEEDEDVASGSDRAVVCLSMCQDKFHLLCLKSLIVNQTGGPNYIECLRCGVVVGEKWGTQPPTGAMTYKIVPKGLPGYEDYHSIQITYNFQNGVQGPNHPEPNKPYFAVGFPRTAFLPDTEKGRTALRLLETAFNRRLVFTIAATAAGGSDIIIWNEDIEHKTEFGPTSSISPSGRSLGYPDPAYLDRVIAQLAKLGVLEQDHDV
jgi:deltex-like protein